MASPEAVTPTDEDLNSVQYPEKIITNKGKLKQILHLLQEDKEISSDEESEEVSPNEDDCFGINLDDD
ncbi:hypothetical protein PIB30_101893 [Stylosanthes scabra]|uniref:Uncharacterized protein n=1 Tax=Stylosanthes scabra TaxID=79078 RepID=A0ABU6ZW61_9FABA|nr:hypothetical protein [Stylosanthes scabra]